MQSRVLSTATRVALLALLALSSASAQAKKDAKKRTEPKFKPDSTGKIAKFFTSEEPITVTLTTNIKRIRGDKGENSPWRSATLTFNDSAGKPEVLPIRLKTHGIWRLKNCDFPPIRLNFNNDSTKHTVFHGLDQPKLTNYCRDNDEYEQYVLRELQLYRIYRLLTPASHAVRLLRVTYVDSATAKPLTTRYAFIGEEGGPMAARLNGRILKSKGATPDDLEPFADVVLGFFQYLIGNSDFALGALHNAEIVGQENGNFIPVGYDFDFSGAVNTRYATPDPRLGTRTVRERIYRGFCVPPEEYPKAVALFNAKKDSIYALYHDQIGKLVQPDIVKETLEYYDDFYKIINDPRALKRNVLEACLGGGRK
jgi:hypothetical protein